MITTTLPSDSAIAAYFALAGLDLGVLAWLFWTTRAAAPGVQRTIGSLMIIVDLVGITAAVLGDTMLMVDAGNKEIVTLASMWIVPIVIMSNVAAGIAAHLFDPTQAIRDAENAMEHELERQRAQHITDNAARIAAPIAEMEGQHYIDNILSRFQGTHAMSRNGNGKQMLAKDVPGVSLQPDEDAIRQAQAVIEAAGGKVTRPRKTS